MTCHSEFISESLGGIEKDPETSLPVGRQVQGDKLLLN
jgi:hypothetical protein